MLWTSASAIVARKARAPTRPELPPLPPPLPPIRAPPASSLKGRTRARVACAPVPAGLLVRPDPAQQVPPLGGPRPHQHEPKQRLRAGPNVLGAKGVVCILTPRHGLPSARAKDALGSVKTHTDSRRGHAPGMGRIGTKLRRLTRSPTHWPCGGLAEGRPTKTHKDSLGG
eukprot:scaffold2926_cov399-Prasinococcus_capsulatus_cf.AAC.15